jgi:primosomal protein N' (replication factor Y)
MVDAIRVGTIVRIPLHGRRVRGWVVAESVTPETDVDRLLPIAKVVGAGPPPELLELGRWTARRWVGSEVALFRAASPPNAVREPWPARTVYATPPGFAVEVVAFPPAADRRDLIAQHLAAQGSSLVLVPEGARLGALVRDLERRGRRVLVLGAGLDDAARTRAWSLSRGGDVVVVGGRTAVWAPVPDLAAVVVLDEADEAYQEERNPTWHARDVVVERARRVGAPVALVGPVPSPEAQVLAASVTRPSTTVERAGWPLVEIVDLRAEPPGHGLLTDRLAQALRRTVDAGDRAVCVLNRKGRARLLTCAACSTIAACERCDAAVIESAAGELTCPRCATARPMICLACHHTKLRASRLGVQKLRDALAALLPRTEIAWLDASVVEAPDAPVIVGTEAVLHRVAPRLAAFLDVDQELFAHRVRANQQAATLVARAARVVGARARGGRMLLQTHHPDHPVLEWALHADPSTVMTSERERRELLGYPPFAAVAELSGEADAVRTALDAVPPTVRVLGPAEQGSGLAALVFAADPDALADGLAAAARVGRAVGRLRIAVDPPRI